MTATDIVQYQRPTVDQIVAAWLHEKQGHTGSDATLRRYRDTMMMFRYLLLDHGMDLDGNPARIATLAQGWAARSFSFYKDTIAPTTYNMRLAILSSFYLYAIRTGYEGYEQNPIARVKRRKVEQYAHAQALSHTVVRERLAAIDTSTLEGQRDKCLLMLALTTGRRLSEIAAMRRAHLSYEGMTITVTFPHAKGGKVMRDTLTGNMSALLNDYLRAVNASRLLRDPQAVWIALGPNNRGGALKPRMIERICEARLGLQHFHALRHTFAQAMEQAGAKVSEIQARLGHSSLAVTGRYLAQLSSDKNPYAGIVEAYFIDE